MTLPAGIVKTAYPDGSSRCHNGTIFDGAVPKHVGPYSDNGETVALHYWNSWWRHRPNPIAIVRSPAQIVAANRMFPFGNTGLPVGAVGSFSYSGPMDNAGLTKFMPTTGERPEIGLITDPSALFMLGGSPQSMIAWAQANDSFPLHFQDEKTGKPINLLTYPTAGCGDPGNGNPYLFKGEPDPIAPAYSAWGGGLVPQQAHFTEMSYVAYCATLDAGFLENVQYNANFTVLADAWQSSQRGIATVSGEYRGVAWAFRNLFMAHAATQDAEAAATLPATCHDSAYWKKLLDNQLVYYTTFQKDPANQYYRLVCGAWDMFGPWQCDYMLTALAFGVLTGHSDWAPLYLWALKNVIDRTSGKSSYLVGLGAAYYLAPKATWYDSLLAGIPNLGGAEGLTPAEIATLKDDPLNGGRPLRNREYLMTTRAVLVMAQYLELKGLAAVKAMYPDLDTCVDNVNRMLQGGGMNPRVSVVLDASGVPTTIPPLPPPVPPITPPPTQDPPKPPEKLPATLTGIKTRVDRLRLKVGA